MFSLVEFARGFFVVWGIEEVSTDRVSACKIIDLRI